MNQFAHFSVNSNSTLQNDDAIYNKTENLETDSPHTGIQLVNDKYSFYTSDSLNKQIFHVNEMIMSSGGNRG